MNTERSEVEQLIDRAMADDRDRIEPPSSDIADTLIARLKMTAPAQRWQNATDAKSVGTTVSAARLVATLTNWLWAISAVCIVGLGYYAIQNSSRTTGYQNPHSAPLLQIDSPAPPAMSIAPTPTTPAPPTNVAPSAHVAPSAERGAQANRSAVGTPDAKATGTPIAIDSAIRSIPSTVTFDSTHAHLNIGKRKHSHRQE